MTTATASDRPSLRPPPPPAPMLVHSGGTVDRYYTHHFRGAFIPLMAGLLLYGWRAIIVVGVVVGSTVAATLIWKRIGRRGRDIGLGHACWLALLMAATLPAQLGTFKGIHS